MRWRPPSDPHLAVQREIWMPPILLAQINRRPWTSEGPFEHDAQADRRRVDVISTLTSFVLGDDFSVGTKRALRS